MITSAQQTYLRKKSIAALEKINSRQPTTIDDMKLQDYQYNFQRSLLKAIDHLSGCRVIDGIKPCSNTELLDFLVWCLAEDNQASVYTDRNPEVNRRLNKILRAA